MDTISIVPHNNYYYDDVSDDEYVDESEIAPEDPVSRTTRWMNEIGLDQYSNKILEIGGDMETLLELSENEIEDEISIIMKQFHALKFMKELKKLKNEIKNTKSNLKSNSISNHNLSNHINNSTHTNHNNVTNYTWQNNIYNNYNNTKNIRNPYHNRQHSKVLFAFV